MSPSALARISLAAGRRHVAGRSDPVRPANELPLPAVDSARAQNWPVFTQLEARVVRMPTVDKVEEAFGSATLRFCSFPRNFPNHASPIVFNFVCFRLESLGSLGLLLRGG